MFICSRACTWCDLDFIYNNKQKNYQYESYSYTHNNFSSRNCHLNRSMYLKKYSWKKTKQRLFIYLSNERLPYSPKRNNHWKIKKGRSHYRNKINNYRNKRGIYVLPTLQNENTFKFKNLLSKMRKATWFYKPKCQ